MLPISLKYAFIIFCAFYLFRKILNLKVFDKTQFLEFLSSPLLAILVYYIRLSFPPASILILIALFISITYWIHRQAINVTVLSSLLSLGCSYVLFVMATFIISPLSSVFSSTIKDDTLLYAVSILFIGVAQLVLACLPFLTNRFKNGMPFLKKQEGNDLGTLLSIILLITVSFFNTITQDSLSLLIPLFFVLLSGVLIFFWWKTKLTESYIHKIKEREILALQEEIEHLKDYNKTLDKIIHKDNKLIPAMEHSVRSVLTLFQAKATPEEKEQLVHLLSELDNMTRDRGGILKFSSHQSISTVCTGIPAINNLLYYLSARAYSQQINFEVVATESLQRIVPCIISESDLHTLIADLVENAFIATKNEVHPHVLLQFRAEGNSFLVEFFDNGAPFSPNVLEKLGKEAVTTHKGDGGNGIGYMSTFEILRRCNATIDINEDLSIKSYKKKIVIVFNDNNT